jgi:hypothetical protein
VSGGDRTNQAVQIVLDAFRATHGDRPAQLAAIYPGYQVTYLGSTIGLVYGLVTGLLIGALFARLYNQLLLKAA